MTDHARTAPSARGGHALIVVGIVLLSFNMRPAAVTIGPVLGRIVDDLHLSGVEAGLLTALPVLSFALFGALTPRLAARVGPHRLTVLALVAALVGMVVSTAVCIWRASALASWR